MIAPRPGLAARALPPLLPLLLVALGAGPGCTLDDLHHEGRYCSSSFPCPEGLTCVNQACVAASDAAPPGDAARDAPDGPRLDHGPGLEGGADTKVGDGPLPDKGPQPDLGCSGGKISCGGTCVDPFSDVNHCGGCDKPCPGSADRCQQGKCHCGDLQPLCGAGLNCVSGGCACVGGASSLCGGCCQNNICQPGTSTTLCGVSGAACQSCPGGSSCQLPSCGGGACGLTPRPDGYPCSGGRCYGGACCGGCWDSANNVCRAGTSVTACGKTGLVCDNCLAKGLSCINQICSK